jgi:hypothetical protein
MRVWLWSASAPEAKATAPMGLLRPCRARSHTAASLIGRLGSSAFRLSTTAVSTSLAGSCFSTESAQRPFRGHWDRVRGGAGVKCWNRKPKLWRPRLPTWPRDRCERVVRIPRYSRPHLARQDWSSACSKFSSPAAAWARSSGSNRHSSRYRVSMSAAPWTELKLAPCRLGTWFWPTRRSRASWRKTPVDRRKSSCISASWEPALGATAAVPAR